MKMRYHLNVVSHCICLVICFMLMSMSCKKGSKDNGNNGGGQQPPPTGDTTAVNSDVSLWLTTGDQSNLLKPQRVALNWGSGAGGTSTITVDTTQKFQSIDGFGYTLTGGSADVINGMVASGRSALLKELFGTDDAGIGVTYLRISIGASDLNASVFSYDDMPVGQTDSTLQHFNLGPDTVNLVPVLKEILTINPNIKILGSPWSPPVWMKDNANSMGGTLLTKYYDAYAAYFVKYIQTMKAKGITIDAVTVQNEPQHGGNNPSMVLSAAQEAAFIKNSLGPAFQSAGITTKIICWDHNCDHPDYPIAVLNDPDAKKFVDGSAFHLYNGDISALSTVHSAHPDKNLYFTEQYTASTSDFSGDLKWHLKNVIIGSMRNWSRNALEWNLANNPSFGPHTNGGCTTCKGALTIGTGVTRNVAYYIIGHASKFVRPGATRVQSNIAGNLANAAFVNPDGSKVLIVENDDATSQTFNIQFKGRSVTSTLIGGAVGTYVWK